MKQCVKHLGFIPLFVAGGLGKVNISPTLDKSSVPLDKERIAGRVGKGRAVDRHI